MKGKVFSVLFFLVGTSTFGQVKFEDGYFINKDGMRTSCQIRNVDWKNNPRTFDYRSGDGAETKELTIDQVTEFGVVNGATFRKFNVKIDRSTSNLTRMTYDRNPEFSDETLFLRVLVEGKATLYQYEEGNTVLRFFYSVDQAPVQQLIYKTYMATSIDAAKNEMFKQQLFNDLKCGTISKNDAERADYTRKSLVKFFKKFNECDGPAISAADEPEPKSVYHLTLRPGLTYNSLAVRNSLSAASDIDFANTLSYQFGAEIENVLPFRKGTWSILVEPIFQAYKAEAKSGASTAKVDYSSLDVSIGARRYFFTKGAGKWYVSAAGVYAIAMNSYITFSSTAARLDISSGINFSLGAGYSVNRFSAEVRYGFKRGVLGNYSYYSSNYSGPALILGYRLF